MGFRSICMKESCFHCGDQVIKAIVFEDKTFCCTGCKTVYEIFSESGLTSYYEINNAPGATPNQAKEKFDFLSNETIVDQLLEFRDGNLQIVSLYIPHIHCSSCIWILENLHKLHRGVRVSQVNFPKKTVRITFDDRQLSLKELAELLARVGYEPYISLNDTEKAKKQVDHSI